MTTPVLPVPELEPTVQRLLSALRPLQDDAEAERTRETARQWLAGVEHRGLPLLHRGFTR